MIKLHVEIEYTQELLGSASGNPDLHRDFIAKKAPDAKKREEEVAMLGVDKVERKDMTIFHRDDQGRPCLLAYQWKGYFKESCGMLRRASGFKSAKLKAYKKEIDGLIFVKQDTIPLILPDGGQVGTCQRPLRASTAQGERVALANSETVPAGTRQSFDILILKNDLQPYVIEWLDYGILHGTGQWRNSGKGCFLYDAYDEAGNRVAGTRERITA